MHQISHLNMLHLKTYTVVLSHIKCKASQVLDSDLSRLYSRDNFMVTAKVQQFFTADYS